jgi:hypothetical protein
MPSSTVFLSSGLAIRQLGVVHGLARATLTNHTSRFQGRTKPRPQAPSCRASLQSRLRLRWILRRPAIPRTLGRTHSRPRLGSWRNSLCTKGQRREQVLNRCSGRLLLPQENAASKTTFADERSLSKLEVRRSVAPRHFY